MNIKHIPVPNLDNKSIQKITLIAGTEISNLSQSCYKSQFKKYYNDLSEQLNINDSDIFSFFKNSFSKKYQKFDIIRDKFTLLLLICIIQSAKKNNKKIFKIFCELLTIKFHASRMFVHFSKFCNDDLFKETLQKLYHKHLYKVKNGISNSLIYLANEEGEKYYNIFKSNSLTDDNLIKFVYVLRTRVAQSLKSFAQTYYELQKNTEKNKSTEDLINMNIHKLVTDLCSYNMIDLKILQMAANNSNLDINIGTKMIRQIGESSYFNEILFIITLMNKMTNLNTIKNNEKERIKLIDRILKKEKVDIYSVKKEIENLIKKLPDSYMYNGIYSGVLINFICQYITLLYKYKY